jgi:hypothetical protein
MSSKPLVSIGLSLSNGDRLLEGVLDSFLQQTFRNFEFILCDDCSTDRSEAICRRYAAQDTRIRYYRNQRPMGTTWNTRRIYRLATGKYFKHATQDALIQPDFLRLCLDALEEDDSLVLAHSKMRVIDEDGQFVEEGDDRLRTSSPDPVQRARDVLLKRQGNSPISGLIRLDALHKVVRQGNTHSDRVLLLRLGLQGRFYEVPEHLFIVTRHGDEDTTTTQPLNGANGLHLKQRREASPLPSGVAPRRERKLLFQEWKTAKEFTRCIAHSPLSRGQRLQCYGVIARWAFKSRLRLATDLVVAVNQGFRNLQNRNGANPPADGTNIFPLDFNPREGESL